MANPNIVNVTNIYGQTVAGDLSTTSLATIVSNSSGSGKIFKVNSLIISNYNTISSPVNVAVTISDVIYPLANSILVSPNSSLIVVSKDTPIYLTENQLFYAYAEVNSTLSYICSYEEIW